MYNGPSRLFESAIECYQRPLCRARSHYGVAGIYDDSRRLLPGLTERRAGSKSRKTPRFANKIPAMHGLEYSVSTGICSLRSVIGNLRERPDLLNSFAEHPFLVGSV